ncbi:MAG: dockerin type I domain-containing protein [Candidatus Electrothrix scaldis]|nr:MAG: dockerin type I domain-containing protein [Candidatus Electrothrix sp. GW3-3]
MIKKVSVILVCISICYFTTAQGAIVSALYENLSSTEPPPQDYHSVWSSSSTGTHTYIAGPSSDKPNASWAANQMFIVKYDNETMTPVDEVTFPVNGYPYFVRELDGKVYIGGVYSNNTSWNFKGFFWILDSSFNVLSQYDFNSYSVYDFTIANSKVYLIGSKHGSPRNVIVRKYDINMFFENELVLPGSGNDYGWDVQYHTDGNIYIAGYTQNGISGYPGSPGDSYFVAQIDNTLSAVNDLIYVGGSGNEFYNDFDIVINGNNLYLGASTESTDMPGAVASTFKGEADAFVAMIDISGPLNILKTLYLGGTGSEMMRGDVFVGNSQGGYLYYGGYTTSTDFEEVPEVAVQKNNAGGIDFFIAKVSFDLSGAIATYIGGAGNDISYAFSADVIPGGDSYLFAAGFTNSSPFPDDPTGGLKKTVTQAAFLTRIDRIMVMKKGDVNDDNCVNGFDWSRLNTYLNNPNSEELEEWEFFVFDLDEDGDLDNDDLDILKELMEPCKDKI